MNFDGPAALTLKIEQSSIPFLTIHNVIILVLLTNRDETNFSGPLLRYVKPHRPYDGETIIARYSKAVFSCQCFLSSSTRFNS